jgi:hypothetical protein
MAKFVSLVSYGEASAFAQTLKLETSRDWRAYVRAELARGCEVPPGIPRSPEWSYSNRGTWKGWRDFLGSEKEARFRVMKPLPFSDALQLIRPLKIASISEWELLCAGKIPGKSLPEGIPRFPYTSYCSEWVSWPHWFGRVAQRGRKTRTRKKASEGGQIERPFLEAKIFVHRLKIKSLAEWRRYARGGQILLGPIPKTIPKHPNLRYAEKGWRGWSDWLGIKSEMRTFLRARSFVHRQGFKTVSEWKIYSKGKHPKGSLPDDIPKNPDVFYQHVGCISWND